MIRKAIFLLLLSMMSVVIGQNTNSTTVVTTMPADNGTSSLLSGFWVLFLTLAVPLLRLLR